MRFALAVAVSVASGVGLGWWRGASGWEMLSIRERLWLLFALATLWLLSALLLRTNRNWVPWLTALALFLLFTMAAGRIFDPRFHLNFNGNGLLCWSRSWPAAAVTVLVALVIRPRRIVSIGLLAAGSAMLSQSIYCSIVESRHIATFHAGQLLVWPVIVALLVASLRPATALR
jgi:hypothetical protein